MQDQGKDGDRGEPAAFDPRTGEVSGSGAGAGNNPDAGEDYDSDLHEEAPLGDAEKAAGGGESQGGAYPNPHSGKEAKAGPDTFMGHGGQTEAGYHGTGQLGEDDVEGQDNANSPAKGG